MGKATPIPDMKPEDGISLEDHQHEVEAAVQEKGGTSNDGVEMSRMGKRQELRVSTANSFGATATMINPPPA